MERISNENMLDTLLYAAAPYAGRNELEEYYTADPSLTLSDRAKKRILKRLRREKNYRERHETYSPVLEYAKRAVSVILIILSIGFVSALSIEAVRETMWEVILEWYDEYIDFSYKGESEGVYLTEIQEYKEPRAIGDEFVRYEGRKNESNYIIEYESEDAVISYHQTLFNGDYTVNLTNESTVVDDVAIGEYDGKIFTNNRHNIVTYTCIWNDGIYMYKIISNLTKEELIKIAESVK